MPETTLPNSKKIFLIINKFAGHNKGGLAVDYVVPFLKMAGNTVDYAFTGYPTHAVELAKKASAGGWDMVVAVGGDGTVNEVAQALIGTKTVLGIIPVGSGNGLARELGLSMNMKKSAQVLLDGNTLLMDVCRLNEQPFLCTSGIGFDARIAYLMSKASSRGFLKYIQLVLRESVVYQPVDVKMKIDSQIVEEKIFLITFANASQFGNNAFIAPGASMTDGLIDVVIVKKFSKLWMPLFAIALFAKLIPRLPFVHVYKARSIELEQADTPVFHFDGDPGNLNLPAKIRIDPAKIRVQANK